MSSYRRTVMCAAACILVAGSVFADIYTAHQKQALGELYNQRSEARAIVTLYRAGRLANAQDSQEPLEETLRKVISAPDTDPEVAAHATAELAVLFLNHGRDQEASRLESDLGYIDNWMVIGPFDDDNKSGYDAEYPPEKAIDFEADYPGKSHSVRWRRMPRPAVDGLVPLNELLDPSEKVAGYALTFIKVGRKTPCVLRGGYNEAYKIWVDGDLVAARKNYNGRAFDQYADACTLRAGWNFILVKVCNQEAGWNFSIRITDARGRALKGWTSGSDPSALKEKIPAILAKDGRATKGFRFDDPLVTLKEAADKEGTAAELEDYGLYMSFLRTLDRTDDANVDALKKAARKAATNVDYWVALGDVEKDHNKSRAAYMNALKASPAAPAALERMGQYYLNRGMPFPAMTYLRKALKSDPGSPALESLIARVELQYVSDGLAARDLRALYGKHPDCPDVQAAYMHALRTLGETENLKKLSEDVWRAHQDDPEAWFARISGFITKGESERALKLFGEATRRFPLQRLIPDRHAKYLLGLNRPADAEKVLKPVLSWAPDWPELHVLNGDILDAMGQRRQALEEYRQALLLKPQLESVKRKVAFLSPEKEGFEQEYRVSEKDLPTDMSQYAGQQAVVLLDNTVVKVQPSGLSSRYIQKVIQVLQTGAAQQLQYYPITFDPDRQEVRVLDASILKADGTKVHADTMVTDTLSDPQFRLYYRNRNLVLSFPSLSAGDRLSIEYKISDIGESNEYGKYFGDLVMFGSSLPVITKQYTLILPESFPLYMHGENLDVKPMVLSIRNEKTYRWVVHDIASLQREPNMPGITEVMPYLHVSTFQTWDAMGKWYANFIADQWEMTPEVKAKVTELTAGLKTPEEKVYAIHKWVVQKTRYVGLEFGVHGFRPYKVRQIFERRFGDCKDKALLMTAMLRQAGLDAAMVLVRTKDNGQIYPTPASLAIFNHCICYVPELNLFLDGTAEYSGMHELPYQDQGIWVQVVWPDGRTKRMETPEDEAKNDTYEADYDLRISPDTTDAAAAAQITVTGQECAWIRSRYQDAGKFRELLEKDLSGTFPGTRLDAAERSNLAALTSPVTLSFKGTLGQAVSPDGTHHISLPMWLGQLRMSYSYASLQQRNLPIELDYPWRQRYSVTYHLPDGAEAVLPQDVDVKTPFGSVSRASSVNGRVVKVTTTVTLSVIRVNVSSYKAFRAFCLQADRTTDDRLRIALPGGKS